MPKITNVHAPQQIIFQLDLMNSEGFSYDASWEDYLNWIPCNIKLFEGNEAYTFLMPPTLSIEGLKNFFQRFDSLIQEKENEKDPNKFINFEYYATEGEFIISFRNSSEREKPMVGMVVWFNMAACPGIADGYYKGFYFWVYLDDLKLFFSEIKKQLYYLTDGNEGENGET